MQWTLYEKMKLSLAQREERIANSGRPLTTWDHTVAWTGKITAAGSAKFIAALLTYPHEVRMLAQISCRCKISMVSMPANPKI